MSYNHWNNETEEYKGQYIHHTDDAILFLPDGWDEGDEVWLPLSQVRDSKGDSLMLEILKELNKHDSIILEIKNWLAEQEGLI